VVGWKAGNIGAGGTFLGGVGGGGGGLRILVGTARGNRLSSRTAKKHYPRQKPKGKRLELYRKRGGKDYDVSESSARKRIGGMNCWGGPKKQKRGVGGEKPIKPGCAVGPETNCFGAGNFAGMVKVRCQKDRRAKVQSKKKKNFRKE